MDNEQATPAIEPAAEPDNSETEATLARHGIVRVPADHFLVDGYRYSNLADAVAQAKRGQQREIG